jgi:hypothetical protein
MRVAGLLQHTSIQNTAQISETKAEGSGKIADIFLENFI